MDIRRCSGNSPVPLAMDSTSTYVTWSRLAQAPYRSPVHLSSGPLQSEKILDTGWCRSNGFRINCCIQQCGCCNPHARGRFFNTAVLPKTPRINLRTSSPRWRFPDRSRRWMVAFCSSRWTIGSRGKFIYRVYRSFAAAWRTGVTLQPS